MQPTPEIITKAITTGGGATWRRRSYLEEIVAAPVKKTETNDRGDPLR
jgi:hypothetical protein